MLSNLIQIVAVTAFMMSILIGCLWIVIAINKLQSINTKVSKTNKNIIDCVTIRFNNSVNNQFGRAFIDREFFLEIFLKDDICKLKKEFVSAFVEPDDVNRLKLIERLLRENDVVQVMVHPGEGVNPEFHAFLLDPNEPEFPLFVCVFSSVSVLTELLKQKPPVVFETATFQVMSTNSTYNELTNELEIWAKRVLPLLPTPRFELTIFHE